MLGGGGLCSWMRGVGRIGASFFTTNRCGEGVTGGGIPPTSFLQLKRYGSERGGVKLNAITKSCLLSSSSTGIIQPRAHQLPWVHERQSCISNLLVAVVSRKES